MCILSFIFKLKKISLKDYFFLFNPFFFQSIIKQFYHDTKIWPGPEASINQTLLKFSLFTSLRISVNNSWKLHMLYKEKVERSG